MQQLAIKWAVVKCTVLSISVYWVCGGGFCSHVVLIVSCMPSLFLYALE